jgi:hypothetical protein
MLDVLKMETISSLLLALLLVIRVVLDFAGLVNPGWRLDAAYSALFGFVAFLIFFVGEGGLFAWLSLLICAVYGVGAFRNSR